MSVNDQWTWMMKQFCTVVLQKVYVETVFWLGSVGAQVLFHRLEEQACLGKV